MPYRVRLSDLLHRVWHDAARYRSGIMAGAAVSGLVGGLHDASSVDADRGQGPAVADALAQSFVAGPALRDRARPDHLTPIPYGERAFQIDLDLFDHALRIDTSDGPRWRMPLHAQSVADFHAAIMAALSDVGIEVHIDEVPNELPDPNPLQRGPGACGV
jgi:Family of unknown function (DUF5996)